MKLIFISTIILKQKRQSYCFAHLIMKLVQTHSFHRTCACTQTQLLELDICPGVNIKVQKDQLKLF